jgi:type VI secretion system FHA domain protein
LAGEPPASSVENLHFPVPRSPEAPHAADIRPQPRATAADSAAFTDDVGSGRPRPPSAEEDASSQPGVPEDYDVLRDAFIEPPEQSRSEVSGPAPVELPDAEPAARADVRAPGGWETADTTGAAIEPPSRGTASAGVDGGRAQPGEADALARPERVGPDAVSADARALWAAFLDGLGAGDTSGIEDPERMMRASGQLLRALTEGLMSIMMARAAFKSELRLEVTTIRSRDNNPFQFCVDPDDALERLLWRHSRGYLDPATAARKTCDDIQAHQMAMIAGLRAALQALLARFDPTMLEQGFEGQSQLDKLLPMARKSKCWDLFVSTFDTVSEDAEQDFMRLFGDAFNRAYEEQIDRLAQARRSNS